MKAVKRILVTLVVLAGALVLYVAAVAVGPGFDVSPQPLHRSHTEHEQEATSVPRTQRTDVRIEVKGTPLSAWLFLPSGASAPVPCIVMAHGFGGTKNMGLEVYASRFQEAGYAALVFDFRYLGDSGGEPRQLIDPRSQLEDYASAVEYARGLPQVDPERIALWGTSYSGGHVIVAAARDRRIACVIAQAPGLDGRAIGRMIVKREGWRFMLRMVLHAQRDRFRSWLGLSPHTIPIVGPPGTIACLNTPDSMGAFAALATDHFRNEVCARILLEAGRYRPVQYAQDVRCPVLLQVCDEDDTTPPSVAEETARRLGPHAEVKHYPIGHFDIYRGEYLERSIHDQLEFLGRHLQS